LDKAGSAAPDGLAAAFVLRTRVARGDTPAAEELRRAAEALGAPGLLFGLR
jgi:hypothetical protein